MTKPAEQAWESNEDPSRAPMPASLKRSAQDQVTTARQSTCPPVYTSRGQRCLRIYINSSTIGSWPK